MAGIFCAMAAALAQEKPRPPKEPVVVSPDEGDYQRVAPGITRRVLWGNPEKGSYAAFTRFAPGLKNALHAHAHDIRVVVLEGELVYGIDGKVVTIGPKQFALFPAGGLHTSGAGEKGVLFYEESDGPFDMTPANNSK